MEVCTLALKKSSDFRLAITQSIKISEKIPEFKCLSFQLYDGTKESFKEAWRLANNQLKQNRFHFIETIMEGVTELFDDLGLSKVLSFVLTFNNQTLLILENNNPLSPTFRYSERNNYHNSRNPSVVILRMELLTEKAKTAIKGSSIERNSPATGRELIEQPDQVLRTK